MSDWYKGGRDNDRNRYGSENRERREFGGEQDRWRRQDRRSDEARSFEERHPDPARGGFTGMSYGEADFTPQDRRGWDFARRREQDRDYGGNDRDEAWRTQPYDERYGREGRGQQDWGRSPYGHHQVESYSGDNRRQGGGMVGQNEPLQRVSDGETDHSMRANMGMGAGEHRGRGPKNYTRSDERIREDVNDRLSDDSWLDASDIEVVVKNCEVTLTGLVHTREDKRRAEDLAERVGGVRHVQNNLRVHPPRDTPAVT